MSFVRSTALRASSFARCARTARLVRTAELQQPWQRAIQRRSYASAHGAESKKSDLPWAVSAVAATALGLYVVVNQDTGAHGEHHDDAHEKHTEEAHEEESEEEEKPEEKSEEKSEDKSKDVSEDNSQAKDHKGSDSKPEDKKDQTSTPPDQSDKPESSSGPTKSANEMSGKQEGLSNTDTKHSSKIDQHEEKSKKGEGVAESAKLKGTVSTERPGAENKEERGKAQMDKNK